MAEQIPILGPEVRSRIFFVSERIRAAFKMEGDIISQAMSSKGILRASEGAVCDFAILVDLQNPENIPDDPTERYYALSKRYKGQRIPNALMVDVKSFRWQPQFREVPKNQARVRDNYRMCLALISAISRAQAEKCQVLVIANMMDPDFVAVIPKPYMRIFDSNEDTVWLKLGLSITTTTAEMCPLPPELSPFIMPVSYLAMALENIAACVDDTVTEVYNPYTGLSWARLSEWQPQLSLFDDLLPQDHATEFKIRERLWQSFKDQGQSTGFRVVLPQYAPITSDVRLDHLSGTSLFIEIKVAAIKVSKLPDGKVRLEHSPTSTWKGSRGIFTVWQNSWDYMISLPDADSAIAWLIKKDDWPRSFWHRQPQADEFLSHDYPDSTFLDAQMVRLNAGQSALVEDICDIICPQGVPQRAELTAEEILRFAGPCPPGLLTTIAQGADAEGIFAEEITSDTIQVEAADEGNENAPMIENEVEDAELSEEDEDEVRDDAAWRGSRFLTSAAASRGVIRGGNEMIRTGRLFMGLMNESRAKGEGCPVFLGNRHPFGSIGFVRYQWSDADRQLFDDTGRPPCWVGNVSNDTPMVTLLQQSSRWRGEYAPLEATPGEIASIDRAQPCLVVGKSFAREIDHSSQQLWLVPSEFIHQVSLGKLKKRGTGRNYRYPLFLADKGSIDRFTLNTENLHHTVSEFLMGKEAVEIGLDQVRIDPVSYLKTFREYRVSSDVNYDRCFSMEKHG